MAREAVQNGEAAPSRCMGLILRRIVTPVLQTVGPPYLRRVTRRTLREMTLDIPDDAVHLVEIILIVLGSLLF